MRLESQWTFEIQNISDSWCIYVNQKCPRIMMIIRYTEVLSMAKKRCYLTS